MNALKELLRKPSVCKLLLVGSALCWGFSFFMMKDVTAEFPVFFLLMVRFGIAALLMLVVFHRRIYRNLNRQTLTAGILIGLFEWVGYAFQTFGLTMTTSGKNAFLTGCYCVLVPFCAWLWHAGRPERYNVIAAFVCLLGLGLVALDNGFPLNLGDLLTLVGAFFYALQMVAVAKWGRLHDIGALTFWQFAVMSGASAVSSLLAQESPSMSAFTPNNIFALLFLGVVCSFVCLTVANHAMTKVDPTSAALLQSVESPSGVLFACLFAGEQITPRLVAGFALIFMAIIFSEAGPTIVQALSPKRRRA